MTPAENKHAIVIDPEALRRLETSFAVVYVALSVQQMRRRYRVLAWLLWRTPLRWLVAKRFVNPYGRLYAVVVPLPGTTAEEVAALAPYKTFGWSAL